MGIIILAAVVCISGIVFMCWIDPSDARVWGKDLITKGGEHDQNICQKEYSG